jgi:uncharacterized protein YuzE
MVIIDAIEGMVGDKFRFHYDIGNDVLYIRLLDSEKIFSIGDLTDDGDILLREETTDRVIGITVISWWKRYGHGTLPDSIKEITQKIEPLVSRMAA